MAKKQNELQELLSELENLLKRFRHRESHVKARKLLMKKPHLSNREIAKKTGAPFRAVAALRAHYTMGTLRNTQ